ncbi:manganese efflux pump MntP family protein [Candidatus Marinarcus aquaticus]|uniref:Putative manganese efflux pump MntP n=1 Tax=Candidatus Marinarcus aquaticus TaxID=2044504 RepID=A0A4Q0XTA2_9BACT|nr:manganese efflux pump MntP family protein [Candidatus Marinarcus aquaticus]RXJ57641.1 manganese efflux pump MntP [Candidatus Marinarcus aquaticus]
MIEVLLLAVALSMDAFAVSIGLGVKQKKDIKVLALKAGLFFGIFQAIMPLIGYLGGVGLKQYIGGYDVIIGFTLLLLIGAKMIYESFGENVEDEILLISNKVLFTLAIATSIDAMAAGFTLHLFSLNPIVSVIIIGIVTFFFSILGVYLGTKGSEKLESKSEVMGGVILIMIGFKLLLFT